MNVYHRFINLPALLFILCAATANADSNQYTKLYEPRYIEVGGESESKIAPDYIEVRLSVSITEKTAETAKKKINQSVNRLFAIAKEFNINKVDQIAEQIQRYPSYQWKGKKRQYLGETIRRTLLFKVRDFDRYALVIDQLSSAPNVQISSTQPRLNNLKRVQNSNLQDALKDARRKAQTMLSTYDQRIDQVLSINEGTTHNNQTRPFMMRQMSAEMSKTNEVAEFVFEPITVKSKVRVRFAIK